MQSSKDGQHNIKRQWQWPRQLPVSCSNALISARLSQFEFILAISILYQCYYSTLLYNIMMQIWNCIRSVRSDWDKPRNHIWSTRSKWDTIPPSTSLHPFSRISISRRPVRICWPTGQPDRAWLPTRGWPRLSWPLAASRKEILSNMGT